jgi:prolyl-tRNA editing enzyme YbaK/EbsC (Cys-tRNA(Pro) deacylase)
MADAASLSATDRVRAAATALGLDIEIRNMADSTRTAEEAAKACGCDVAQIVKSLIFQGVDTKRPHLLLVSGANRVNEEKSADVIGEKLTRPNAAFVRDVTGFAIGGIPPFGHTTPMRTLMDEHLLQFDVIWAAAGTPHAVFPVSPAALRDALGATVTTLT